MIKVNNGCVSKCRLHCLEKTKSKYCEALVLSDGLTKHRVLVIWENFEMKKQFHFVFRQKFCVTLFTDFLRANATIRS